MLAPKQKAILFILDKFILYKYCYKVRSYGYNTLQNGACERTGPAS